MFLIRDVFRCKPGKAAVLARKFLLTVPTMESEDGFRNVRVMTDYVATYGTVVLQAEVDDVGKFDALMRSFSARPEVKEAMAGYMDLVADGHREIYGIVES